MPKKQAIPTGNRSHPQLQALDALASGLTYAGWKKDVKQAEDYLFSGHPSFDSSLVGMTNKQAMHRGDRSHPRLQALDALVASGLTYEGWQKDVKQAVRFHVKDTSAFDGFLARMTKKQAIHTGDRTHPQLRELDALVASGLTYAGWQTDVKQAENSHVSNHSHFGSFLARMSKKQAIHTGDRSHPQLAALDALVASGLTYEGWKTDVEVAERYHENYPSSFDGFLLEMTNKQAMHNGDRSHSRLQALDALVASGLTYADWQEDVKHAETCHVKDPSAFAGCLEKMTEKHKLTGDRSHPRLTALDALVASGLTYTGWQEDVTAAERLHVTDASAFDSFLAEMTRKQACHKAIQTGDRSHPRLQALDALVASGLTYTGWEDNVKKAEDHHVSDPSAFDGFLAKMSKKQALHTGNRSHAQLQALDALVASGLTFEGWAKDVESAEGLHVDSPSTFESFLQSMRVKQHSLQSAAAAPPNQGAQAASAAAVLLQACPSEAAPDSQQTPSLVQAGGGDVEQSAQKRSVGSTDADDGEEEGGGASKKARIVEASGEAAAGGGPDSDAGASGRSAEER